MFGAFVELNNNTILAMQNIEFGYHDPAEKNSITAILILNILTCYPFPFGIYLPVHVLTRCPFPFGIYLHVSLWKIEDLIGTFTFIVQISQMMMMMMMTTTTRMRVRKIQPWTQILQMKLMVCILMPTKMLQHTRVNISLIFVY